MMERNGLPKPIELGIDMDFYDKLKSDFPLMYEHGDIYVGEGWQPIIFALSSCIQSHLNFVNRNSLEVAQVKVTQIKEKFGGLRFYYDGGDDYIDGLVRMAEAWADKTCEMCGKPGEKRGGGWIKTLCDEHDAERKSKYGFKQVSPVGSTPDTKAV